MNAGDVAFRFIVSGRVQGVFFRASSAQHATRLGIRGHAVNLPDGRVEVLAVGPASAIEEFGRWLRRGPPSARVDSVESREESSDVAAIPAGFYTR
jgi:acylphosphatase